MDRRSFARPLVALAALLLPALAAPAHADPISIVALGDSLTDSYKGKPYSGTNLNWVDQLTALRPAGITVFNLAGFGSTSTDLLNQGQHTTAAGLGQGGFASYATLIIGANDLGAYLAGLTVGGSPDPTPFVSALVANVKTALDTLQATGKLRVALGNVPDIGATPNVQQLLQQVNAPPVVRTLLTQATQAVNAQLEALAAARGIPVVDLFALNNLPSGHVTIGGTSVDGKLYGPDGFHPSTIGQALLANTILDALRLGYHADTQALRLTDQEILNEAGLPFTGGPNFNTAAFVKVQPTPEPSTLALLGLGALGLATRLRRRA